MIWFLIVLTAQKEKIRQYLPALLYASASGFALDLYFAWRVRAYAYTTFIGQPLASIITGVFISPGFALLFIHFLPTKKSSIAYYTLAWVGLLVLTEYIFLRVGELTFHTWHLGYSTLAYLVSLSILVLLARLYGQESANQHSKF